MILLYNEISSHTREKLSTKKDGLGVPWWLNGLRIQCGHSCGTDWQLPHLGAWPKISLKKNQKNKLKLLELWGKYRTEIQRDMFKKLSLNRATTMDDGNKLIFLIFWFPFSFFLCLSLILWITVPWSTVITDG